MGYYCPGRWSQDRRSGVGMGVAWVCEGVWLHQSQIIFTYYLFRSLLEFSLHICLRYSGSLSQVFFSEQLALYFMEGADIKKCDTFIYLLIKCLYLNCFQKILCKLQTINSNIKKTSPESRVKGGGQGGEERTTQLMLRSALAEYAEDRRVRAFTQQVQLMGVFSSPQRGHTVGFLLLVPQRDLCSGLTTVKENCPICIFLQHLESTFMTSLKKM